MLYLTHALHSTSTRHAIKADFIQPSIDALILGKHSVIEVYGIETEGLKLLHQSKSLRRNRTHQFIQKINRFNSNSTSPYHQPEPIHPSILANNEHHHHHAKISLQQIVDPHRRCVLVHALNGILHVIPLTPPSSKSIDPSIGKRKKVTNTTSTIGSKTSPHPNHNEPDCEIHRAYQIRLNEVNVQALSFAHLPSNNPPTLLIVYSNHLGDRVLRSRKIDLQLSNCEQELFRSYNCRDPVTGLIIPITLNDNSDNIINTGAILIGEESAELICFQINNNNSATIKGKTKATPTTISQRKLSAEQSVTVAHAIKIPLGAYTCFCKVDTLPQSWLLGDTYGNLILLSLTQSTTRGSPCLQYRHIGHVPSPEALVYIPQGFVFLASHYGDSQLLKLAFPLTSSDSGQTDSSPRNNLAPISDFCITEDRKSMVNQIVTCSGAYRDGSLRVIKHGIGLSDSGSLELGGVQRLWALKSSRQYPLQPSGDFDDRLILSCADSTRFLALNEDGSIEEIDQFEDFQSDLPTVIAGNLSDPSSTNLRYSVQVTARKVTAGLPLSWEPDLGKSITSAALGSSICTVALKRQVYVLRVKNGVLVEEGTFELSNDISSLAIDPSENFVAAGQWVTNSVEIISLSTLARISRVNTGSDFMVNSLMMTNFERNESDSCRLLIGLGDGKMMNVGLDNNGMILEETQNKTTLGIRPIEFISIKNSTGSYVWANSDQPSMIDRNPNNGRFSYTPVTTSQGGWLSSATNLNTQFFQDSVVYASNNEIRIVSLGNEQPRRIAYSPDMRAYGVICIRLELDQKDGILHRIGSFKIFDDQNFHYYSITTAIKLGNDLSEHFVVGTGLIKSNESEAKMGRILAIRDVSTTTTERDFRQIIGSVGGIAGLPGGMFVASANAFVHAFGMKEEDSETIMSDLNPSTPTKAGFKLLDTWGGGFVSQTVITNHNQILVGDLYKSLVLLEFDLFLLELVVKARDFSAMSVRPIGFIDSQTFVSADSEFNLFTVQHRHSTQNDHSEGDDHEEQDQDEEVQVDLVGHQDRRSRRSDLNSSWSIHLGENVNHFRPGSLVPKPIQSSLIANNHTVFVTSTGAVGFLATIHDHKIRDCLSQVYDHLSTNSSSCGNLNHSEHRTFKTKSRKIKSSGFIDGDFIEDQILNLSLPEIEKLGVQVQADDRLPHPETPDVKSLEFGGLGSDQKAVQDPASDRVSSTPFIRVLDYVSDLTRLH
ncbi:hypothetical protein PSHT_14675 [Puccinia striiformis]|uniref:Cleavage/polyadenylation specificity factor A subunit N-terminal domain-containing protein n=1 Tax=Puccinia striiformis TaxID=27350 RepID=A0A2S4UIX1_9BASI|nr:hypothetical protein PSHT_14675 [Puccinia striiformis]